MLPAFKSNSTSINKYVALLKKKFHSIRCANFKSKCNEWVQITAKQNLETAIKWFG